MARPRISYEPKFIPEEKVSGEEELEEETYSEDERVVEYAFAEPEQDEEDVHDERSAEDELLEEFVPEAAQEAEMIEESAREEAQDILEGQESGEEDQTDSSEDEEADSDTWHYVKPSEEGFSTTPYDDHLEQAQAQSYQSYQPSTMTPINIPLGIIAFIFAFFFPPLALILGIMALSKKEKKYRGFAIAAVIMSIAFFLVFFGPGLFF